MRKEVYEHLSKDEKLLEYVRMNPRWYRQLTRNPKDLESLELASMNFYKKTIPHRVEQFASSVQMASMMFHMLQAMRNND